jgi:hypothetical protein
MRNGRGTYPEYQLVARSAVRKFEDSSVRLEMLARMEALNKCRQHMNLPPLDGSSDAHTQNSPMLTSRCLNVREAVQGSVRTDHSAPIHLPATALRVTPLAMQHMKPLAVIQGI